MQQTNGAPSSEDHLRAAVVAFGRGDYATSLPVFQHHADDGDRDAQAWLGSFYANGTGVVPSLATAYDWYLKAAEQGHIQAGVMWLEKAAEAGDAMARYTLATLYAKGGEVPQDNARAAELYRLAAESGHYPSQARLGHLYANGIGVAKDRVSAFAWFSLAAQHGIGTALNALEALIAQMSAEEKGKGLAMAQMWRGRTVAASGPATINPLPA
jgi:TPR repeat protein